MKNKQTWYKKVPKPPLSLNSAQVVAEIEAAQRAYAAQKHADLESYLAEREFLRGQEPAPQTSRRGQTLQWLEKILHWRSHSPESSDHSNA